MEKILEVCCADLKSVIAAAEASAGRIELCAVLASGGVTPSRGMIATARAIYGGTINVLIRVREGNFVFSSYEKAAMLEDITTVAAGRCDGVVTGALTSDGDIDLDFAKAAAELAKKKGLSITFHRAFDHCRDRRVALEQLIALGYDRVLTSAGAADVEAGKDDLKALCEQAAGRIIILPGGGVNLNNAADIISYCGTTEIHGSCRAGGESSDPEVIRHIIKSINHQK